MAPIAEEGKRPDAEQRPGVESWRERLVAGWNHRGHTLAPATSLADFCTTPLAPATEGQTTGAEKDPRKNEDLGGERGATALEEAIILIAFVVVASVFAYTVLSAGILSSYKGQQSINSGLDEARATLELENSVTAKSADITIDSCDTVWAGDAANKVGTCSRDTGDKIEGTSSAKVVCSGAYSGPNDLLGYHDISTLNLGTATAIQLWVKSDAAEANGHLEITLCTDDAGATRVENLDIPALNANTWIHCEMSLSNPANCTAIESVGLDCEADPGTSSIWLDDIRIVRYIKEIELTVSLPVARTPAVDLTPPYTETSSTDLDPTGYTISTIVTYSDASVFISDCAWAVSWVDDVDSDWMLDQGEKVTIHVWLVDLTGGAYVIGAGAGDPFVDSAANLPRTSDMINIEMKPSVGSPLVIQRTLPSYLSETVNLA